LVELQHVANVNETHLEWIKTSWHVANMNEDQVECWQATEQQGHVIYVYAGENVSDEAEILLICVPCEV
jgi:hypothetical protein